MDAEQARARSKAALDSENLDDLLSGVFAAVELAAGRGERKATVLCLIKSGLRLAVTEELIGCAVARLRQLTGDLQQLAAGLEAAPQSGSASSQRAEAGDGQRGPEARPGGPEDVIDADFTQR